MSIITLSDYRSITNTSSGSDDAYIQYLIGVTQSQMEVYCDRYFDSATYYEWFDYSKYIVLRQYPVTLIKYIGTANKIATFSNSSSYTFSVNPTQIDIIDGNLSSTTITLGGTNDVLSNVAASVTTAIPTMILTVESGYGTMNYRLFRSGTGETMYGAARSTVETRLLDDENRTLELLSDTFYPTPANYYCSHHNVYIVYDAGYTAATYPKALQYICAMIIKDIINVLDSGVNFIYQHEGITNYDYTLANGAADLIHKEIDRYKGDLEPFVKKTV